MSAMEFSKRLAALAIMAALPGPVYAQAPISVAPPPAVVKVEASDATTSERFLLTVEIPEIQMHERPDLNSAVVGRLEQGTQVEANQKSGDWYQIRRASGAFAWVLNTKYPTGAALDQRPFPADSRIATETGSPPRGSQESASQDSGRSTPAGTGGEDNIERARPQGVPLEPRFPLIDPSRVAAPSPLLIGETIPVPDRWRILKNAGLVKYSLLDPYNPNVLKGDLPVLEKQLGKEWFFNLGVLSDTLYEARRLPTPTGAQSTRNAGSNGTFGRGRQSGLVQTGVVSLALIKGDTTFRPPDYEFRFVPAFNINRAATEEVRAVNINPARGVDRNDSFVGVQELFFDKHLRDVSQRYDFDSLRVGIQPFTADFRGFLFLDQPFGLRLFGTRDNNQWQYNLAWFRRLDKDTNSGLNDIGRRLRSDDTFVFNLYRQDAPVLGFTSQGVLLYNRNREGQQPPFYSENGLLERPAIFGTGLPHNYDVTYLGYNGDGHFGKWNVSASAYYAKGTDERGMFSGRKEKIGAHFGALEVSRDFDWVRVRLSGLYASGDKDPYDGKATGFDSVLENPQFAGADTSYWIRQAVPLIGGGGVALSMRNGVLPSLRTSREFGQSNFTNPGLHLFGIGADFDVAPGVRVISNLNYLEFDNLSSLAVLRNQRLTSTKIGLDASVGVQYRPFFTQNVVVNTSAGALFPYKGLREIYGNSVDSTQYSVLFNVLLTF